MSGEMINKSWVVTFSANDSFEDKLKKAAHVKPSEAQLAWMEKEYIAFVHFGPNTFSGRQWGTGEEAPSEYAPKALDPLQWAEICAKAGFKMLIYTFKHHDGFCQWDTASTDHSIINSPAKADLAKLLMDGCKKHNIGLGVYLSPWDMYQRNQGLWNTPEYNEYFLKQLNELLSEYGAVDEVWFDGACGDYIIWQMVPTYQPDRWYDLIEATQANAVFRMYDPYYFASEDEWEDIKAGKAKIEWRGKAVRWVGNEEGKSREDEWSVQPVFDRAIAENATFSDLGQEKYYQNAVGAIWYPVEVNTTVLNQWFWNPATSKVKSLNELIDIYYNSIGNNGVLLLNLSPDRSGRIPKDQIERLMQLKEFVANTYCNNLASGAAISASAESATHKASCILDNDKMTYWTTDGNWDINSDSAYLIFDFGEYKTFDNVMVQEYIREGQRIAAWSLDIPDGDEWRELVRKQTIGYKNIKRFKKVTTNKVRLNILRSWDNPMISNFGLYLSDIPDTSAESEVNVKVKNEPIALDEKKAASGLEYNYYNAGIQSAELIETLSPKLVKSGFISTISTHPADASVGYSFIYKGFVKIPVEGKYGFKLESADGSILYINETILINNDEPHDIKSVVKQLYLKDGYYPIKLCYTSFRNKGHLQLSWWGPGFDMEELPADKLFRMRKSS